LCILDDCIIHDFLCITDPGANCASKTQSEFDKYVAASLSEGTDLEIDAYWLTSNTRCEALLYDDIMHPEKAFLKWVIEFKFGILTFSYSTT